MKHVGLVSALCIAALIVGCGGQKETVVRITEMPTIDTSGVDQYVSLDDKSIASGGLFVQLKGTAKAPLGQRMRVSVTRFRDGERLDTKTAYVTLNKPPDPSTMPPPRDPGADGGPPEEMREPPPPPPDIVEGDPVQLLIDASCEGGKITKLVVTGGPAGGGMRPGM